MRAARSWSFSWRTIICFTWFVVGKRSLIQHMSEKVVDYIYPLIGTPSNDLCILLSFPVGRSINPIWVRNELFPFFFRAVTLNFFRGLEQMKPFFFLLGPLWLLILSSLFLASGLASSWGPCLFRYFRPLPVLKKPCPRPLSYEALASSLLPKNSQSSPHTPTRLKPHFPKPIPLKKWGILLSCSYSS